ncbi:MAG: CBS domain-containing protein [Chloroflexi bacterium]|nr:CBS domain-containing protein [Chloroflexota bacterium]
MPFLSDLLGRQVTDVDGMPVGRLEDIIASPPSPGAHPLVVALVARQGGRQRALVMGDVAALAGKVIVLNKKADDLQNHRAAETDLYLARDALDKQIIDVNGVRVVRVNDLELARVNQQYFVANVDTGTLGLLRRLGLARFVPRPLARRMGASGVISWHAMDLLPGDQAMRLKVSGDKIADLHPADLAEIISDLSRPESARLLESLDVGLLADTLEEVEPDFQASLVEAMADEKVADVLEEMAPDEAADLLAELPQGRSREILRLMEGDEAAEVRHLLSYPEESAGGIMTTDYFTVRPGLSAQEVIALLRQQASPDETINYIYVTNPESQLMGVFSLQDLVLVPPKTPVSDFMHHKYVSVLPLDSQDKVAQLISKYNLSAIPVIDEQTHLKGIVTADDALDKILPTKWKKRLPRLYH